ncbi:hypothetical protein P3S68_013523 [Capsicum galapagoense]
MFKRFFQAFRRASQTFAFSPKANGFPVNKGFSQINMFVVQRMGRCSILGMEKIRYTNGAYRREFKLVKLQCGYRIPNEKQKKRKKKTSPQNLVPPPPSPHMNMGFSGRFDTKTVVATT